MVTQAQVIAAEPLMAQLTALQQAQNDLQSALAANALLLGPFFYHDQGGNTRQIEMTGLDAAASAYLINVSLTLVQAQINTVIAQLADI